MRCRPPSWLTTMGVTVLLNLGILLYLNASHGFPSLLFSARGEPLEPRQPPPIVSLASSSKRLASKELVITLRSLLHQSLKPKEIRVYVSDSDRDAFELLELHLPLRFSRYLRHEVVQIHFVTDLGPSTKFFYAIKDHLERGLLDGPIIVVDDDHSYSPSLVSTLFSCSQTDTFANASVGLRGWRVRRDLHWGVAKEEYDDHVVDGSRLADPFRVSILTANEGYLIKPRFFLKAGSSAASNNNEPKERAPILDAFALLGSAAHLVDDIYMAAHLSFNGVERHVVPLTSSPVSTSSFASWMYTPDAIPSIDVTKHRPLEDRMQREGQTRAMLNSMALHQYGSAWLKEGLFYVTRAARNKLSPQDARRMVPMYLRKTVLRRRQLLKYCHHVIVRSLFGWQC